MTAQRGVVGNVHDTLFGQKQEHPYDAANEASKSSTTTLLLALAICYVLLAAFTATLSDRTDRMAAFAVLAIVATAALMVGAGLGFLFGLPRAAKADSDATIRRSTNLEEVADWLTKILVGVGLTQLAGLPEALGTLIGWVAPAFGDTAAAPVIAGGVVVLFPIVGFLLAFMFTTTKFPAIMAGSDAVMKAISSMPVDGQAKVVAALKAEVDAGRLPNPGG